VGDVGTSIDWPALLLEFRATHGLKQGAAAQQLGVAQATISRWERGESTPSVAMRNRLIRELLHDRLPPDAYKWVSTFRRLPFPAAVFSEDDVAHAVTSFLASKAGVAPEVIEGLGLKDVFEGEVLDVADQAREAGVFIGRMLSFEACVRLRFSPRFKRGAWFNVHFVAWPHILKNERIAIVCQGVFVSNDEARRVRRRLGGATQFQFIDGADIGRSRARRA
jgi:DNA-binding XRE family transcriptional regulator